MKKIYNALFWGTAMLLISCYTNEVVDVPANENIIIELGGATRAADDSTESYVSHVSSDLYSTPNVNSVSEPSEI